MKTESYGKDWRNTFDLLSETHKNLQAAQAQFIQTLGGSYTDSEGNTIYKEDAYSNLRGRISMFFLIVRPRFEIYLKGDTFKQDWKNYNITITTPEDYEKIILDYKNNYMDLAFECVKVISYWANKYGPFAIYIEEQFFDTDAEYLESRE